MSYRRAALHLDSAILGPSGSGFVRDPFCDTCGAGACKSDCSRGADGAMPAGEKVHMPFECAVAGSVRTDPRDRRTSFAGGFKRTQIGSVMRCPAPPRRRSLDL